MKKIAKVSVLLMVCLSLLIPVSVALAYVPPNFTVSSFFTGSGVSRIGYCSTGIVSPRASYKAAVKCELQHNDGTRIGYSAVTGTYGGPGVSTHVHNVSDTGRIVLWSTHDMWVGADDSVEYRVVESLY